MIPINILFHALLSFFGRDEGWIACTRVIVTLDPTQNTMLVVQEDLFGLEPAPGDTATALNDLHQLMTLVGDTLQRQQSGYRIEEVELFSPDSKRLDARIRIRWTDVAALQDFGITPAGDGRLAIVALPTVTKATNATREDNYYLLSGTSASTFTIEAFRDVPRDISKLRVELLPIWQRSGGDR